MSGLFKLGDSLFPGNTGYSISLCSSMVLRSTPILSTPNIVILQSLNELCVETARLYPRETLEQLVAKLVARDYIISSSMVLISSLPPT
jgi:hypothetical protein